MKIAPQADPHPYFRPGALPTAASPLTFASLLDGPSDIRQQNETASFGFSELGPFGRAPHAAEPNGAVATTAPSTIPQSPEEPRSPVSKPPPSDASVAAIGAAPRNAQSPARATFDATINDTTSLPITGASATPIAAGRGMPVAPLRVVEAPTPTLESETAPDRQSDTLSSATTSDVSVLVFEEDGLLQVVATAPAMTDASASRLRRMAQVAAADAGLSLSKISLNGTALPDVSPLKIGGHNGYDPG